MKKQDIIMLLIPTFLLVFAWIGFNIYHSAVTSTISSQENIQIIPINSSFNTKVIEELKKREKIESIFLDSSSSASITIIAPSPIPITITSITSTQSASTNSGEIIIK